MNSILLASAIYILANSFMVQSEALKQSSEYQSLHNFAKRAETELGLEISGFGRTQYMPDDFHFSNCFINFQLQTEKVVDLETARSHIVCLARSLLKEINSNSNQKRIGPDNLKLTIRFCKKNKNFESGILFVSLNKGNLEYTTHQIPKSTNGKPANFSVYSQKETYSEALWLSKKNGELQLF
ncbi:MAG: hypothetical protein JSS32_00505 [Verrucomicrobia bacterium]|nr:hypothetical protein [Verrucomicrobiota bacterium]